MAESDLRGVLDALADFGGTFDKANDEPVITKTVGDDVSGPVPSLRKVLSDSDRMLMQRQLASLSLPELGHLFRLQMSKQVGGIPVGTDPMLGAALGNDPVISKVLDTTGGAALQRQDLDPILYTIFVKVFPAYERFRKIPANGLVHAWKGDRLGNLVYRKTARNFSPMMATAGRITVAEVEQLVEPGELDGDNIHTPGIFVQRVVVCQNKAKLIERRTTRKRS